ncbi:hypothetical protein Tco_1440512 [Tanacetum coccineum]
MESLMNVMSRLHYNWFMSKRLVPRRKPSNPKKICNFVGRVKRLKVFVWNFTYKCDFVVLEDTTSIIDHDLGSVVFRKPFVEATGLIYERKEGTITFEKDKEKIVFKMPHKLEMFKHIDFTDIKTDRIPPFVIESDDDKSEKTHYSDSFDLGPEYKHDENVCRAIQSLIAMKAKRNKEEVTFHAVIHTGNVGIKRLLDDLRVTATKVLVTAAKHKLVLRDGLEVADGYANNERKEILKEHIRKLTMNCKEGVQLTLHSVLLIDNSNSESPVEQDILVYKKNESVYEEDIKLLKREIYLKEVAITELRRKLELAQKQKDKIQLTYKCKTGLAYNVVPPPYTGNFMPPKHDLSFSGIEEFVNEPIVSESTVKKPVVETSKVKASADKPKVVKKNNGALILEELDV